MLCLMFQIYPIGVSVITLIPIGIAFQALDSWHVCRYSTVRCTKAIADIQVLCSPIPLFSVLCSFFSIPALQSVEYTITLLGSEACKDEDHRK